MRLEIPVYRSANMTLVRRLCDLAGHMGRDRYAGRLARANLETLIASPDRLTAQLEQSRKVVRRNNRLVEMQALEALRDVMQLSHAHGMSPFLFFGTLLGVVRDQSFVPGDSDIDLGVLDCECLNEFRISAEKQGYQKDKVRWKDGRLSTLALRHPNGSVIDLKDCLSGPGKSTTWFTYSATLSVQKRFPLAIDLKETDFKSVSVYLPTCATEYLEWQYGPRWRVPDPTYHYVTSGPVHGLDHEQFVTHAGPIAILHMLHTGRVSKAKMMTESMAGLFPDDQLWPRLAGILGPVGN